MVGGTESAACDCEILIAITAKPTRTLDHNPKNLKRKNSEQFIQSHFREVGASV
ncbi:hypothetical protein RMSM_03603 [Rhodopirellula maiorica SM1]|uniref:Uncharacterized protein n=1 Tax=Rhodopirellula maiorica SM1 TaxID=1265738 RepID=M5RJW0_9BACT|nr:hypothetical protein RMSM_03603 [Rhodopirellula maiorica SM1]